MAADLLTRKGSMGFNSGAPKHQLIQGAAMPIKIDGISAKPCERADPIYRVNEIGARPPIGPITQD